MEADVGLKAGALAVVAKTPLVSSGLTHMGRAMSMMEALEAKKELGNKGGRERKVGREVKQE